MKGREEFQEDDGTQAEQQDPTVSGIVAQRVVAELGRLQAKHLAPGLYLVATPIGNLADITLRALSVLARADLVYCEDTRHSRTLLAHYGIARRLAAYHDHNAAQARPRVLAWLGQDRSVALVSDAGTPLVSDPGLKLVRTALEAGHRVYSVPGPSAVPAALAIAGLPTDTFLFAGFLPSKSAARRARLSELAGIAATLVLFEGPQRLAAMLADAADVLGPREAAVARELTKLHEQVQRGSLAELAEAAARQEVRGEIVVLIAPALAADVSDEHIARALAPALAAMSLRDAARSVAAALGVAKGRVYAIAVAMKRGGA